MVNKVNVNFCGLRPDIFKARPNLIGGPRPKYSELKELKGKEEVGLVVDLRHHFFPKVMMEKIRCFYLGIEHSWTPLTLKTSFPERDKFQKIADKVNQNSKGTYVHCRSGKHRTNFVLYAIQIINEKLPVETAIKTIQEERNYWKVRAGNDNLLKLKHKVMTENLNKFREMFSRDNYPLQNSRAAIAPSKPYNLKA